MATDYPEFLKGKKILLTSFSYALFGGAELNPIELAEQLVEFGAKPYFFSYDINGPLAEHIHKKFGTKVITDSVNGLAENESQEELKNTHLNIDDYDYIWVGGNTVPISIIRQINTAKKLPKFIFIHMSQLVAYPLDAPLLVEFEKKIASRILSISERATIDCVYRILGRDIPLGKWYNPAPREFRYIKKRKGDLKRIAVISSSHPTDEVMEIKDEIERHGIKIDYIGRFNNNVQVVDARFYDAYDLIIGIGKNVKYSLVSGVPIYIYGRFGGGGYLNSDNFVTNDNHNFSGRGFGRKNSKQIVKEIVEGYQEALKFHETRRDSLIQEFSIDIVAGRLFMELEQEEPRRVRFSEEYINWLVSMQITLMQRIQTSAYERFLVSRCSDIENELTARNTEINTIYASRTWRVTRPVRVALDIIKRKNKVA